MRSDRDAQAQLVAGLAENVAAPEAQLRTELPQAQAERSSAQRAAVVAGESAQSALQTLVEHEQLSEFRQQQAARWQTSASLGSLSLEELQAKLSRCAQDFLAAGTDGDWGDAATLAEEQQRLTAALRGALERRAQLALG